MTVARLEVSFLNSYIGWDVMAYDAEGFALETVADVAGIEWTVPEYYFAKRDAVARARELLGAAPGAELVIGLRKDGGWYPEGLKA